MIPIEIKTENDIILSVQTVEPVIDMGKVKLICNKQFCLLIQGELYSEDKIEELCEPVLLDKEGAKQLIEELEKFIKIPF